MDNVTEYVNASVGAQDIPSHKAEYAIILPVVWGFIVIVGSLGNGLVIFTLLINGEKTPTNCYIINLAVADLAFLLIVVPVTSVAFAFKEWMFGDFICKIAMYMIYVTMHATCFTLTAMTIDRYHAIVHAVSSMKWRSRRTTSIISLVVWTVSFLISTPFVVYHGAIYVDDFGNRLYCLPTLRKYDYKIASIIVIFTTYILPLFIIVVCYTQILRNLWTGSTHAPNLKPEDDMNSTIPLSRGSQSRRRNKVTRMVTVVVLLFALCWLPAHVFLIYRIFNPAVQNTTLLYITKMITHTLSYVNSILNPFVYAFLNDSFRKAFKKTFPIASGYCPCTQTQGEESDYVDRAIQTRVGECQDENGNGGTEIVSMSHVSEYKSSIPLVLLPNPVNSSIEEKDAPEDEL